VAIAMVIMVKI